MKVLLVDQIAKVAYKYTYSLANALHEQGVYVDLVIDQKKESEDCACNRTNLFNTDEKDIGKIKKLWNYLWSLKAIRKMMKGYDILHTQWIIFSPVDYIFFRHLKKMNKRIVVTIHDILPFNKKFYDYYFHKKIYALADEIILQTEENVERFRKLFPENRVSTHMIPHGHFMRYAKEYDSIESRKKLGIPEEKFVYLFFGQIKKVKGVDVLLKAYAEFLRMNPARKQDTLLIIAGNTWKEDPKKYYELVKQEHIENQVKMELRYIPDDEVDYYYSAADVSVLPYRNVYQSGVLQLTYAHHRVPIVTDIKAFTEIVNSEIGFVCRANDENALADTMLYAYNGKSELQNMAEKGYSNIEKRFAWDRIAKKVKDIYIEVTKDVKEN